MLPLGTSLDISNAQNWELSWAGLKTPTDEDKRNYSLNRRWLPPFDIPVLIDSNVIAVKTNCATARPTWSSAGVLIRLVDFPKDEIVIEDDFPGPPTAVLDRRFVRLNSDFEILIFNQSSSTLKLSFIPRPWIFSLGIVVYAYTGPVNSEVLDQLQAIRDKLELMDDTTGEY